MQRYKIVSRFSVSRRNISFLVVIHLISVRLNSIRLREMDVAYDSFHSHHICLAIAPYSTPVACLPSNRSTFISTLSMPNHIVASARPEDISLPYFPISIKLNRANCTLNFLGLQADEDRTMDNWSDDTTLNGVFVRIVE